MNEIGFIFTTSPYSSNYARDGFDMFLSIASYTDNITVFFLEDAVFQLVKDQQPVNIMHQDYSKKVKLFELYEIKKIYICKQSLKLRNLVEDNIFDFDNFKIAGPKTIKNELRCCDKILRF